MVTFKSDEVKSIGKVQISAKKLKELADKLKESRGSDENEVVEIYIVPAKEEGGVNQLAFDFSKAEEKSETKKDKDAGKEEVKEVKEEQPKSEEKPEASEPVKKEETPKPNTEEEPQKETNEVSKETVTQPEEKPQEQVKKEDAPEQKTESAVEKIVNNEELAQKAKEINQEAYKNGK